MKSDIGADTARNFYDRKSFNLEMFRHIRILYRYRDLMITWTLREIRIRYKQSIIGGLWAVLQPLILMIVFTLVFSVLARLPTDGIPYPIFSYSALLPWLFFSTSISFAVPSLVNNMNLVTKIYFPREILPIASVGAAFFDYLIASVFFFGLMAFYRIPLSRSVLWLPLLLTIQILLILGIVFFASAVNVFYRDIRFVIPLAIQIWMYATPIIYPVTLVPERFRSFYMINPMAGLIESYRRIFLTGQSPVLNHLFLSSILAILVFITGYIYFKRSEAAFADMI